MAKIEIYTSPFCGYCSAAKRLLDAEGVEYSEYDVMYDAQRKVEMLERSNGRRTVPQIFIDAVGIGGYTELRKLQANKQLDAFLDAG